MGENLMPTDRGISLYRRRTRRQIKDLENGTLPPPPVNPPGASVRTYGQDTILTFPPKSDIDDRDYLMAIGAAVMDIEFEYENCDNQERDATIIDKLKELEAKGIDL